MGLESLDPVANADAARSARELSEDLRYDAGRGRGEVGTRESLAKAESALLGVPASGERACTGSQL